MPLPRPAPDRFLAHLFSARQALDRAISHASKTHWLSAETDALLANGRLGLALRACNEIDKSIREPIR